ncbi:MAG: hypothetical protein RR645_05125, partial [Clostridium sp.]
LISKVGVCDGYAISMKKMLDKIDIPNIVVVGTSAGVGHAWNIVKLNGKWQHVDSTWDDPIYRKNGNIVQIIRYDYFLKSDEYMKKDHIWNTANYPKALEVDLKTKVGVKYNRKLIVKK